MGLDASSNVQALSALGVSMNATASNIANSLTEGYQPLRAEFADGPGGQGVQVADVRPAQGSGSFVAQSGETGLAHQTTASGLVNGVDLAREMVGLMQTERAFSANATMVRAVEETTGHVLNLIA